jgi:hypothetical protein
MANDNTGGAQGQAIFYAQTRRNYAGRYQAGEASLECYTPRQMKSLYPTGEYEKVGEYAPGKGVGSAGTLRSGAAAGSRGVAVGDRHTRRPAASVAGVPADTETEARRGTRPVMA